MTTALARNTDPQTSHLAAAGISSQVLSKTQNSILNYFKSNATYGEATDEQIEQALGGLASPSSLRTRRHELVNKGLLHQAGITKNSRGKQVYVWKLTNSPYPGRLNTPVLASKAPVTVPLPASTVGKYVVERQLSTGGPWFPSGNEGLRGKVFSSEEEANLAIGKYASLPSSGIKYRVVNKGVVKHLGSTAPLNNLQSSNSVPITYKVEAKINANWRQSGNTGLDVTFDSQELAENALRTSKSKNRMAMVEEYRVVDSTGKVLCTFDTETSMVPEKYIVELEPYSYPGEWYKSGKTGIGGVVFTSQAAAQRAIDKHGSPSVTYRIVPA